MCISARVLPYKLRWQWASCRGSCCALHLHTEGAGWSIYHHLPHPTLLPLLPLLHAHLDIHHGWRSLLAEKEHIQMTRRRGKRRRRRSGEGRWDGDSRRDRAQRLQLADTPRRLTELLETFRVSPHFIQLVQFNHAEEKTFWCLI